MRAGDDAARPPGRMLVLIRHGESTANLEGRYAGWSDVALTQAGIEQARAAGRKLRQAGLEFDLCYTSVLKRATHSLWHCLDAMDRTWVPVVNSWRLNERHYGALQGLSKAETELAFGRDQVRLWRRGFGTRPPAAGDADRLGIQNDCRYGGLDPADIPGSESMQDTVVRLELLWDHAIAPSVASGRRVLVVAHGTTLRAFSRLLSGLRDEEVERMEVPNGAPFVYELDHELKTERVRRL
ncbi:2,3-bisphosphoglycerate-dependent phosphoglycerate mutase [Ramlibacter sp. AN1133]|uniref:2,3-bisphosphoglycerate-dependent phosphoglycerate mutase n=1 Tax=Ramlibacter sp. AN1133 TaxID=3133429 RepID=UPI0030C1384F